VNAGQDRRPAWLTRNLLVLCGVSFAQDAASELLYPVLPIFLTSVLGAPVAVVGIIEGLAEGSASVTKIVAGRIADGRSKRPLIALGYGMAAVGKVLIALAYFWPVVLAGRVVDRLGKGIRGAPRDALLFAGTKVEHRGRIAGLHRAADTAGAVVGPLVGLAGYELLHHHIRPLLVIAVVPAVLSVVLVRLVREPSQQPAPRARATDPTASGPLPRSVRKTTVVLALFGLVNLPDALLLLRVQQISHSLAFVVLTYAAYNAVYALLSYPAGALSDTLGSRRVFAVGLACFAVTTIGLGLTHSRSAVWPLLLVYGAYTATTDGVGKAWISRLAPEGGQGRAQGAYQGITGGAALVAGTWAGLAWHGDGRLPLVACGVVTAVLSIALALNLPQLEEAAPDDQAPSARS
jgi:MFS family permease